MTAVYLRRLLLMLVVVLPITALAALIPGLLDQSDGSSLSQLIGFWGGVIVLYGTIPAAAASLVHTYVIHRRQRGQLKTSRQWSVLAAMLLGLAAGTVVALLVITRAHAVTWGVLVGVLYGVFVSPELRR
jgi:hypothetical protein